MLSVFHDKILVWTTVACVVALGVALKKRKREIYVASVVALVGVYIIVEAAIRGVHNDASLRPFSIRGNMVGVGWYQDLGVGILVVIGSGYFILGDAIRRKKPNKSPQPTPPRGG